MKLNEHDDVPKSPNLELLITARPLLCGASSLCRVKEKSGPILLQEQLLNVCGLGAHEARSVCLSGRRITQILINRRASEASRGGASSKPEMIQQYFVSKP